MASIQLERKICSCETHKISCSSPSSPSIMLISNPIETDILFGRCADAWNHEGNRAFRVLIAKHQGRYHSVGSRLKKMAVVIEIVKELKDRGCRMLKKAVNNEKMWEVIEDEKSWINKIGHAIRDRRAIVKRKLLLQEEREATAHAKNLEFARAKSAAMADRHRLDPREQERRRSIHYEQQRTAARAAPLASSKNYEHHHPIAPRPRPSAAAVLSCSAAAAAPASGDRDLLNTSMERELDILLEARKILTQAREKKRQRSRLVDAVVKEMVSEEVLHDKRQELAEAFAISQQNRRRRMMLLEGTIDKKPLGSYGFLPSSSNTASTTLSLSDLLRPELVRRSSSLFGNRCLTAPAPALRPAYSSAAEQQRTMSLLASPSLRDRTSTAAAALLLAGQDTSSALPPPFL